MEWQGCDPVAETGSLKIRNAGGEFSQEDSPFGFLPSFREHRKSKNVYAATIETYRMNLLRLQRKILLEKQRRLNLAIYFMEYAEMVNRDPQSGDGHYLAKVVEAIKWPRDPE